MSLARIKKGDTVQVISGREKGKTGKILAIITKKERALVEHLNMIKRHTRPQSQTKTGGIIEKEAALPLSVMMPFCPKCKKGVRVSAKVLKDHSKTRVCAKCGENLDNKK
ncbi:MAG: 50S ribosomal protein L24 [Deltaproteobacteria bacterium]|nr:50S ribosomal protein L24 [Deltaproteobacteria bacterium]